MTMIFSLKWRRIVGSRWYEQSVRYDGSEATAERAVPQGIKRMWDKDNGKNDVKNTLNAIGYPYALRLSFWYDIWYSVRYESFWDDCHFEIGFRNDSRFEIPKSSERLSIRYDAGLSLRYDRANMTVVFKWHTAPVDCESVRGSQIFFALKFSSWNQTGLSAFRDENGRKYGYRILRSRIWLYAVMVESLAITFTTNTVESLTMPFMTKMENMLDKKMGKKLEIASIWINTWRLRCKKRWISENG